MKRLSEFLQEPEGYYSSKRLVALASFVVAVILAFQRRDLGVVGTFLGLTTAILVGQAFTKT